MRAAAAGLITVTAAVVALAQDVAAGRIAVGDRAAEDACGRGQALQGVVAASHRIRRCMNTRSDPLILLTAPPRMHVAVVRRCRAS